MVRHRAPVVCPRHGCINDQPCPTHTPAPWAGKATRRPNVPSGRRLQERNARILARDRGICHVCGQPGADKVDHLLAQAHGGTEDDANLAAIHDKPCHAAKTRAEAQRGRGYRG